ncbi:TIGR03668 family PPOX class F420-dependent oxidoreductase [Mangrovihabitans endophyticus]|uniref:PPOX class F420-dependent oxidoreductase n=1 Tax=Mangrovihabitans endophyticus TaxID=1751298 RepID=A0A8J3BS18_9ACTN|nr:TIGR03668 family PPOX class F420-dependent oxidoreductase [Mangrovihabitans endophyticus]GGK72133.1 PPOX class F420-dependent oxidoreductase [Mangrovihabitans endophyticus]
MTPAQRFATARVARLATVRQDGTPHLVPIVFAVDGDTIWSAVDHKPKRHRRLRRLDNIAHQPRVSVLADHYDDDWDTLWWVRADGVAEVLDSAPAAGAALAARYSQYRDRPPGGPFLRISVLKWVTWRS